MYTHNATRCETPARLSDWAEGSAVHPRSVDAAMELVGAPMNFARKAEIFGENEPNDYVYKVVNGAVRTYRILRDGRRQITAFYFPGDIFGLEVGDEHQVSAEAVVDSTVLFIKRSTLVGLAARDGNVAYQLWALTARELKRVQDHMLLLIQSAQERVACFLLEMAERSASIDSFELPMGRQDIADYLGLTIETVSRMLTALETNATIAVPSCRHIVVRDRRALRRLHA
jgi:CRP/FNR family nitrogen fixation transcriptional regulator